MLQCVALDNVARHFFTIRGVSLKGGVEEVARGWDMVAREIGVASGNLWRMTQVHGADVFEVPSVSTTVAAERPTTDALMTAGRGVALVVQVADCIPLLLADRRTGVVAATHAGWRGSASRIVARTIEALSRTHGVLPETLVAAVGPSIGPCCYQVGPDVREAMLNAYPGAMVAGWFRPDRGDRLKLDMWQATSDQLVDAGVLLENIHIARLCTATHVAHLHSYRVEGAAAGRMAGVIRAV